MSFQTNATIVTLHPFVKNLRDHIEYHNATFWSETVSTRNHVMCVIIFHEIQTIWGSIWEQTVEKNQTNAARATLLIHGKAVLKGI